MFSKNSQISADKSMFKSIDSGRPEIVGYGQIKQANQRKLTIANDEKVSCVEPFLKIKEPYSTINATST